VMTVLDDYETVRLLGTEFDDKIMMTGLDD
jgi:hypothetical protein